MNNTQPIYMLVGEVGSRASILIKFKFTLCFLSLTNVLDLQAMGAV